jgi:hypothetical protein
MAIIVNSHHTQLHQAHHHHYNFTTSKVWSTEPEDMGMGVLGLTSFVGAGSPCLFSFLSIQIQKMLPS